MLYISNNPLLANSFSTKVFHLHIIDTLKKYLSYRYLLNTRTRISKLVYPHEFSSENVFPEHNLQDTLLYIKLSFPSLKHSFSSVEVFNAYFGWHFKFLFNSSFTYNPAQMSLFFLVDFEVFLKVLILV